MGFWNHLVGLVDFKVETGRCRDCCRSDYYCCDRPLADNEQARFDRISQIYCTNKSPEEAAAILIKEDSWHPQATRNCVDRWYGELTEGQGYATYKKRKKPKKRQLSKIDKLLGRQPPEAKQKPWSILTTRYGDHKKSPTAGDLSAALYELYHENISYKTESDYAENPNACIRCGFNDGAICLLDLHRTGKLIFQQWADQDSEKPPAAEITVENVTEDQARRLWDLLMDGEVEKVKAELAGCDPVDRNE